VSVTHACNPSYEEAEINRIIVRSQLRQIVLETLFWKHPTQERAGGVVQVVDYLPSKDEALSSNPRTNNHNKKKWYIKIWPIILASILAILTSIFLVSKYFFYTRFMLSISYILLWFGSVPQRHVCWRCYWEVGEPLEGGAYGRNSGHWGHAPEKDIGTLTLSVSFVVSLPHFVSSFAVFCHDALCCHKPRAATDWNLGNEEPN
jgi:hypothetical protein